MANTITSIVPQALALMLPKLRASSVLPQLMTKAIDLRPGEQHSAVDVPIPPTMTAVAVTPAITPPANTDTSYSTVSVPLANWQEVPFYMTDKDKREVMDGTLPRTLAVAAATLGEAIDLSIIQALEAGGSRALGTAGTTPFATLALAIQPGTELNNNKIPFENRHVVVNPAGYANLLAIDQFGNTRYVPDQGVITQAKLDENARLGFNWWMNQQVYSHTAGTGASYLVNNGSGLAVGTTTIAVDTGSGTILVGDVVSFAGDSANKYVVTGALSGGSFTIGSPGIRVAIADNAAVTVAATHVANVAFQSDQVAFAMRPFVASAAAIDSQVIVDPITGLAFRLEVTRQHKQDRWSIDALWGVKVVRPDGVLVVMG